jgi:SAM-dependent methyltransferase
MTSMAANNSSLSDAPVYLDCDSVGQPLLVRAVCRLDGFMAHQIAARGYDREAGTYARSRPTYPIVAVAHLCARLGLSPGDNVIELGAGTGILTRLLLAQGLSVVAVEPVAGMRRQLAELPALAGITAGSAEATGLPTASADAVVTATAWHWFDARRAIAEVRRVLRPSGALGLIWNRYDNSVPWVAELADISNRRRPADAPGESSGAWRSFFDALDGWNPLGQATQPNPWPTTPQGIVDRVASSSVVAALLATERKLALDEAWTVLRKHGLDRLQTLDLPYTTHYYWTRPIAP